MALPERTSATIRETMLSSRLRRISSNQCLRWLYCAARPCRGATSANKHDAHPGSSALFCDKYTRTLRICNFWLALVIKLLRRIAMPDHSRPGSREINHRLTAANSFQISTYRHLTFHHQSVTDRAPMFFH